MTPDAISGKTGFTGNAGYCYVAACEMRKENLLFPFLAAAGRIIRHINGKMP